MIPVGPSSNPIGNDYSARLKSAVGKAVETDPQGRLFEEKFQKVESYINQFETDPRAIHKMDPKGNAVTVLPDVGSLKRTANGFEMSILRQSYFSPPLGLAQQASWYPAPGSGSVSEGLNVHFNEKKGKMDVQEYQGGFMMGHTAFDSASYKKESTYTLNVNGQTLTQFEESVPSSSSHETEKKYGRDLTQPEPSKLKEFFRNLL